MPEARVSIGNGFAPLESPRLRLHREAPELRIELERAQIREETIATILLKCEQDTGFETIVSILLNHPDHLADNLQIAHSSLEGITPEEVSLHLDRHQKRLPNVDYWNEYRRLAKIRREGPIVISQPKPRMKPPYKDGTST